MKGRLFAVFTALLLALGGSGGIALADVIPLGTDVVDAGSGEVTVTVSNANGFAACFEYRTDGDAGQASGESNFNDSYTDLYPYFCLTSSSDTRTYQASAYVEIRSVFGADSDVNFDWRRFDVLPVGDGGSTLDMGDISNENEADQSSGQDQNQASTQDQVSSQHTTNTVNQSNVVSGKTESNLSSGCQSTQEGADEGASSVDCSSSGDADDGRANGNVTQTSTAVQVATILNEQAQSQTGGDQSNTGSNANEQQVNVSVQNTGGDVTSGAVVNVNDHSDDDVLDIDGTIDNSSDNDAVDGDNTSGTASDGTDGAAVGYLKAEVSNVIADHLDQSFGDLIDN